VDFGVKSVDVNGFEVRVNFWDLSGHPEFFDVRNEFYKDTQGGLLVFDVTSRRSFENLDNWLSEARKFGCNPRDVDFVVIGNHIDKSKRAVSESEARNWAKEKGFSYFEVSANTGANVADMFESVFQKVVSRIIH